MACNNCKSDRPDILRSNIGIHDTGCSCNNDCTDNCESAPTEKECDCPYGYIGGRCIHYGGCGTFLTSITPGMSYDEIVNNIEQVFKKIDDIIDKVLEENALIKERVTKLEKEIRNGKECTDFE